MICIFFEGSQYIPVLEDIIGRRLEPKHCDTPYGNSKILICQEKGLICIPDAGMCFGKDSALFPLAVAYVLKEFAVKQMCIISKVGGINKLMHVGDIVIPDDYYDNTTIYHKSFLYATSTLPPRYDMLEPFSPCWRKRIYQYLKNESYKCNIFDRGIYVCTDGPGFESKAEIAHYNQMNIDMVGHYLSPYIYYARELKIALVCVSVVSNSFDNSGDGFLKEDEGTAILFGKMIKAAYETRDDSDCEEQKNHWIRMIN